MSLELSRASPVVTTSSNGELGLAAEASGLHRKKYDSCGKEVTSEVLQGLASRLVRFNIFTNKLLNIKMLIRTWSRGSLETKRRTRNHKEEMWDTSNGRSVSLSWEVMCFRTETRISAGCWGSTTENTKEAEDQELFISSSNETQKHNSTVNPYLVNRNICITPKKSQMKPHLECKKKFSGQLKKIPPKRWIYMVQEWD